MLKRQRKRLFLYTILAAAIAAVVYYVTRPAEPQYAGKPLSYWVDRTWSSSDPDPHGEALKAVRDMGTNAVPQLIQMLGGPKSLLSLSYERFVLKLPGSLSEKLYFQHTRDQRAAVALGMIGPEAAPAVPALVAKLGDFPRDLGAVHPYAEALVQIGSPAAKPLGRVLFNADSRARWHALRTLGELGVGARDAVPDLIRFVEQSDQGVERGYALLVLQNFKHLPETLVPFLMRCLDDKSAEFRIHAAKTLGEYGPLAAAAAPKLREKLPTEPPEVQKAFADALARIEPSPAGRNESK